MAELASKVCAPMVAQADAKQLEFDLAIHPGLPATVMGDPGRLRQVLTNLLSNAVKFTPVGGQIRVIAEPANGQGVRFEHFTKEAYAVYPMGESADVKPAKFDIRFGLAVVDAKGKATGENIALKHMGGRTFRTERPLVKGTRFKVEVTNSLECYTYIFGQETDGSTYTLFPYTPKHSPYCGITGTRVFPKDNSLTIDDVGTMDVMAILVANQAFDYPRINESMKANSAQGLNAKLEAVLGAELTAASGVQYAQGTTFGATAPANANALAIVIEVEKR